MPGTGVLVLAGAGRASASPTGDGQWRFAALKDGGRSHEVLPGMSRGLRLVLAAAAALAHGAAASPPAPGSEDGQIMAPYQSWITTRSDQHNNACCDIGDGRPVEADLVTMIDDDDVRRTHWRAHVTPNHFPDQPDHWVVVPDEKIGPGANPTGSPILWLYKGLVQCFAPPAGL